MKTPTQDSSSVALARARRHYDRVSPRYDRLCQRLYGYARKKAVGELRLPPGSTVLDLACGTGLNFPLLVEALGPEGRIIGLDYSHGMLSEARAKIERNDWANITLIHEDARNVNAALLQEVTGVAQVDGLICTLGLTVVPDWQQVFERSFSLLKSGGRCVLMDGRTWRGPARVFNPLLVRFFKAIAAADNRRPLSKLLENRVDDLQVSHLWQGPSFIASGTKR